MGEGRDDATPPRVSRHRRRQERRRLPESPGTQPGDQPLAGVSGALERIFSDFNEESPVIHDRLRFRSILHQEREPG
ncbi:hypothetical protein KZ820_12775 [Sphingomonas sp. RRHST34]|uniref:Uncharacterized protein n=1 Tax=Sphingomonas citri TaxID=2862499 RepID=A0ABS7BPU5_9SPHN|nr:hypothetical protein [Sphingomonas citri]MBW6531611.1 hypothetical protein [Sphingomonas citri]